MQKTDTVNTMVKPEEAINPETRQQILRIIEENSEKAGAIIRVLQQVQGIVGYLPPAILRVIASQMKIPLSEVYGIVSFYHFFSLVPKGKYVIQVCLGTSCYVKGAERILKSLRKDFGLDLQGITADGKFSLSTVRCLGACGLAPVITVGQDIHRKVKPSQLKEILSSYE